MALKATIRGLWWVAAVAAGALCASAAPAQTGVVGTAPASPYERLDKQKLAKTLKDLRMTELLDEVVRKQTGATDIATLLLLIEAKTAKAVKATDQDKRDALLAEAMADQDELIKLTSKAVKPADKLVHYQLLLRRIVVEGITRTGPYVGRIQYFHARPGDADFVAQPTKNALNLLRRLNRRMDESHEEWGEDTATWVEGHYWRLEDLIREARYRGAWIRLNRALAGGADADERQSLLRQAIDDVEEYANAADNSSGVKFRSLLLTGTAYRLLGDYPRARSFLARAADEKQVKPLLQLKAMFEAVVSYMDQAQFDQARTAIADFRARGTRLVEDGGVLEVTVDFQEALLNSRLLEVRAKAVRDKDPEEAEKLEGQSLQALLDFLDQYPAYETLLLELIAAKHEGKDATGLSSPIKVALGRRAFERASAKSTDQAQRKKLLANAEEFLELALADKKADASVHAMALWHLALVNNKQGDNDPAAEYFRRLAAEHPDDPNAERAARNAVISLQGALKEKKTEPADMGVDFVRRYKEALKVLVARLDSKDPQLDLYHYEYAQQLKTLALDEEAMAIFDRIKAASEYYLPSRFEILVLRTRTLINADLSAAAKRPAALSLMTDLRSYRDRAAKYKSARGERVREVRGWGAECDLMIAQVTMDVLNLPSEAVRAAMEVAKRWPDVPEAKRRAQQFIVRRWLEKGSVEEAIAPLVKMLDQEETVDLVAEAIDQIRERIETLQYHTDEEARAKLGKLRGAYKVFARKLYDWSKAKWAGSKDRDRRMYAFKQALAGACESGSEPEAGEALAIYQELAKQNADDWLNIRGLARCYRRLGNTDEAKKHYERLTEGLPEMSTPWWRAQLELLGFYVQAFGDKAEALEMMLLQIHRLRVRDNKMSGYRKQFSDLERRVLRLLADLKKPAA